MRRYMYLLNIVKKAGLKEVQLTQLMKFIAIDEYKSDIEAGEYQLIIVNTDTHEPIEILAYQRKSTIKHEE